MQINRYSISKSSKEYCQLQSEQIEKIGKHDVLVRNHYIGINRWDLEVINKHKSENTDTIDNNPSIGMAAVGEIVSTGKGITKLEKGTKVVYLCPRGSGFSDYSLVNYASLFPMFEEIKPYEAAAYLYNVFSAYCLLRKTFNLKSGHNLLIHGVSGSMGQILSLLAGRFEAKVIGTVGNFERTLIADKIELDEIIDRSGEAVQDKIKSATSGKGVNLAIDNTGGNKHSSLRALGPFGLAVLHGALGKKEDYIDLNLLRASSGFVTVPNLIEFKLNAKEFASCALECFEIIRSKKLSFNETKIYEFNQLNQALEDKYNNKFNFAALKV